MTEMTLVQRIKNYFEMTNSETIKEVKALSQDDKQWFTDEFNKMGLPTVIRKATTR